MYIFTNSSRFGGTFENKIQSLLSQSTSIEIASGYTSEDMLQKYKGSFNRIASRGGDVTLLIGMALFEGLSQSTYDSLLDVNQTVRTSNPGCGGVRVVWHPTRFHGKIYRFECDNELLYFSGSSNFSRAGLRDNLEFTNQITDTRVISETEDYLNWLLDDQVSANISNIDSFPIIERITDPIIRTYKQKVTAPVVPPPAGVPCVDISLSRVDRQPMSNLNSFFGKGRWNRATGKVIPRPWFEVEIIADVQTTRNPNYPKGDFIVRTDYGEVFPCRTQGSYYKNLRSRRDLKVLGRWIKGKLQMSGTLKPYEPVTSKTLQAYGRDYIRLYKISQSEYFIEF